MKKPARYVCEFTVRATVTERQRLLRVARQAGLSLSRYLITSGLRFRGDELAHRSVSDQRDSHNLLNLSTSST